MIRKSLAGPLICQKRYPKEFIPETIVPEDHYPVYHRRDNGRTFTVPKPGVAGKVVVRNNR